MNSEHKSGSFLYTLLGYLLILAILIVVAFIIGAGVYWFLIVPGVGLSASDDTVAKWIGLPGNTLAIFWWVIKQSRPRWHNKVFWWTTISLLFVHIACFLVAFRFVQHWTLWYFFLICTVEGTIILTVVNWTFERFGKKHHTKGVVA